MPMKMVVRGIIVLVILLGGILFYNAQVTGGFLGDFYTIVRILHALAAITFIAVWEIAMARRRRESGIKVPMALAMTGRILGIIALIIGLSMYSSGPEGAIKWIHVGFALFAIGMSEITLNTKKKI